MDGCICWTGLRPGALGLSLLLVASLAGAVEPRGTTPGQAKNAHPAVKAPVRVAALSFIEPDGTRSPVVEVWSNGQVKAIEVRGTRQNPVQTTLTDQLTPQELQGLLQLLVRDCQLETLTTQAVQQSLQTASQRQQLSADIEGAAYTEIGILAGQQWRTVSCPAVSILTTRFPDVAEVQQVAAAQSRLQNIAAIALAGGSQTADCQAASATLKLREMHPAAGEITRHDLHMVRRLPNGSRLVQFRYAGSPGQVDSCLVCVTHSPEGQTRVSLMDSPTVVR